VSGTELRISRAPSSSAVTSIPVRSASEGSTAAARRAGRTSAAAQASRRTTAATVIETGSSGGTPNSSLQEAGEQNRRAEAERARIRTSRRDAVAGRPARLVLVAAARQAGSVPNARPVSMVNSKANESTRRSIATAV
jgi:hypothetical protein